MNELCPTNLDSVDAHRICCVGQGSLFVFKYDAINPNTINIHIYIFISIYRNIYMYISIYTDMYINTYTYIRIIWEQPFINANFVEKEAKGI